MLLGLCLGWIFGILSFREVENIGFQLSFGLINGLQVSKKYVKSYILTPLFASSFDVCRASQPISSINYGRTNRSWWRLHFRKVTRQVVGSGGWGRMGWRSSSNFPSRFLYQTRTNSFTWHEVSKHFNYYLNPGPPVRSTRTTLHSSAYVFCNHMPFRSRQTWSLAQLIGNIDGVRALGLIIT